MFEKIIRLAIENRWLVLLIVLGIAGLGIYNYKRLPIEAVPDITNVQVQINTKAAGFSPLEVEQRITYPIETVMAGLPHLEQTRSLSRYGLSQVTVIFEDGTDIYFARQLINQRIQEAKDKLPPNITPEMGPISTGLGEIYLWIVEAKEGAKKLDGTPYTPDDLREIQDWIIKPQLRNVAGVTEINTSGGFVKQYLVAPIPEKLASYGLTMGNLVSALERNNINASAGYIEKQGEQYLVRAPGQLRSMEDIENIIISTVQGVPIHVADVGRVVMGRQLRTGASTENGQEVVLGTVFMLIGQNSRTVSQAVNKKMIEISRSLPEGIVLKTVYDRTVLVDKAISTVKRNLTEGALLVVAILFLFLGNIQAAIITALVIPLAMLFTFTGMVTYQVSANLMSLGALDFGIIIDGAVVIVENCVRRLAHVQAHKGRLLTPNERFKEVFTASKEARRALLFGQLIIMVVYLPIFALTGVEAKMFHPMAFTVVTALIGAMLLSITFIPASVAILMRYPISEKENLLMQAAKHIYAVLLSYVMRNKGVVLTFALVSILLSGLLVTKMGSEFIPSLNEGDFAFQSLRIPGTSLTQSLSMQKKIETSLKAQFPEIQRVFASTGTPEVASDPMPPNLSDGYIMLNPHENWPQPSKSRETLLSEIQAVANKIPGNVYEFSQPIQLRFNELVSGVRSDVAVRVFGDDMVVLNTLATQILEVIEHISGASDAKVEQTTGLSTLTINIDRHKASRYGVNVSDIQDTITTAIGGTKAGTLFEGDRRFDIVVRLSDELRNDVEALKRLPIFLPSEQNSKNAYIPLAELATIDLMQAPNQISRENGKRRVVVTANIRGRDLGSFVEEAQHQVQQQIKIPAGYWISWGGQFEQLQSASKRLQIVIPIALALVFTLLFMMFNNVKDGLLVFSGIPFALTGGLIALWLRDIPMSISAAVGFIALSGVAVLNGLVMISFIRNLRDEGLPLYQAIYEGSLTRLRPVLMTALVASLGFIPMAIATETGAEVQRPLATVVIGGILSSTMLTLLVLPILYWFAHLKEERTLGMAN